MAKRREKPRASSTAPDARWSPLLPAEDLGSGRDYTMRIEVRRYKNTAWHLANVPRKHSAEIRRRFGASARGWGSIRVRLAIGDTQWNTSLFPDRKSGTYLFLVKAAVRKAEGITAGKRVNATLHVL